MTGTVTPEPFAPPIPKPIIGYGPPPLVNTPGPREEVGLPLGLPGTETPSSPAFGVISNATTFSGIVAPGDGTSTVGAGSSSEVDTSTVNAITTLRRTPAGDIRLAGSHESSYPPSTAGRRTLSTRQRRRCRKGRGAVVRRREKRLHKQPAAMSSVVSSGLVVATSADAVASTDGAGATLVTSAKSCCAYSKARTDPSPLLSSTDSLQQPESQQVMMHLLQEPLVNNSAGGSSSDGTTLPIACSIAVTAIPVASANVASAISSQSFLKAHKSVSFEDGTRFESCQDVVSVTSAALASAVSGASTIVTSASPAIVSEHPPEIMTPEPSEPPTPKPRVGLDDGPPSIAASVFGVTSDHVSGVSIAVDIDKGSLSAGAASASNSSVLPHLSNPSLQSSPPRNISLSLAALELENWCGIPLVSSIGSSAVNRDVAVSTVGCPFLLWQQNLFHLLVGSRFFGSTESVVFFVNYCRERL